MKRTARCLIALLLSLLLLCGGVLGAVCGEAGEYYRQLTEAQKGIYDSFNTEEALGKLRTGEEITLPAITGSFGSDEELQAILADLDEDLAYAFSALELDHPELFWLEGYSMELLAESTGDSYTITVSVSVSTEINWADGTRSIEADAERLLYAVQAVASLAAEEDGAYAQLRFVHDYLTDANLYNEQAAMGSGETDYLPWTPLSALLEGLNPVCEGYSRAFKLICDELGIPCILVDGWAGEGHMWNQVKLNGQWYAVDVTWDDPVVDGMTNTSSGYETHDYFLVGSGTPVEGDLTFSDTHFATGERLYNTFMAVPPLSPAAFDPDAVPVQEIVRQDIPETGTSYMSTQTVEIGGSKVELPAYALRNELGYPTNYVRLRDLAALLDGTAAEFDVLWSDETRSINIVPFHAYDNRNGTENNIPFTGDQPYTAYLNDTYVGSAARPLTAFQIIFEGGGHTYYQLRDLGRALNFNVGWNETRGIYIEPGVPYTDAD